MRPNLTTIALAGCLCLPLAACGEEESNVATVTETQTVVERAAADSGDTQRPAEPKQTVDSSTESPADDEPAADTQKSGEITVPDVEGIDHQVAQDTMQAAGLYSLTEEDASGKDRALLWDRNWTVVSQSPKAGSRVSEGTTITLRSIKDEEYGGN